MAVIAAHASAGVDDLDPAGVLARVADAELAERRAALSKLELALHWCVLHPATVHSGVAVWGDAGLPGLEECDESLGGEGCPLVSAYAPEPFAAALGVSTSTGMQLLADALDLAHRLPHTWAKVKMLAVAAWRARRLAQATHHLSHQAAAHVDERLADRLEVCGVVAIDRAVAQAAAMFEPRDQVSAEDEAEASWGVTLLHRTDGSFAGTSHLEATGDTLDLTRFYDLVCDHAAHLARLGDTSPLGSRKAKALGVIADAQAHLDLSGITTTTAAQSGEAVPVRRPSLAKTRLYAHISLTDLMTLSDPLVPARVGGVERLGPVTLARIRDWIGQTRATIVPVLDLSRDDAVDQHDPPEWMRETVVLRDRHCVFPWCRVDARSCDLDHIAPYVPLDEGGPPEQTRPSNLACLCRRHHNAKTTRRWTYARNKDGTYTWRGPHQLTYLVTPHSTQALPNA